MKKNLAIGTALFVFLFLFSFNVFSQIDTVAEQVTDTIPYSISVDTSRISTGILYDNAIHFINAKDYTGLNDSVYMNEYDARQLFSEMKSASIRNTETMANIDDITILINEKIKQGKYPFYILNYDYNAIKSYAIDSGLIQIQNHIITDGLNRTESPYETNHLFAACPVSTKFLQSEINFEIVPILYLTNSVNMTNQIQIDFGDGIGWRNVNWNDVITIAYSDIGYKEIRLKVTFSNSTIYESKSKILIEYLNSNARTKANGQDQFNFTASIPYNGGNAKGIASVVLAPGHTCITKPFIFVEGIEFGNTPVVQNNAIVQYGDIGYVAFTQGPPSDYPQLLKLPVLISQLQNNGYDIIIVDFEDAATYIQRNAFLLIDIIKWVNDNKCSDNENVVVGASMGGLVTRYALMYMEQHPEIGKPHCTKIWCTFDTPHKGANIPLGAQLFIKHFADPKFGNNQDARDALSQKMWREATQQMLIYHLDETTRAYMHNTFWYEMAQMGNFPQKLRRIAIANGSYTMNNQGYNPGDEMIKYHWSGVGGLLQNDGHVFAMNGTSKKVKGKTRNNLIFWGDLPKKKTRIETTSISNLSIDNAPGGVGNQIEVLGGKQYYSLFTLHGFPSANYSILPNGNIGVHIVKVNIPVNMYVGTVDVPHSKFCFIPSISALAINTTSLTYNFLTNIPNQSAINNSISPFNSIYTNSSGQNELHVEITDGHNQEDAVNSNSNNIAWLINELQNSEDVATILPTISGTIHSTFNYGSTYNPFIKSCTIKNNGILSVNKNAAFGFGNFASSPTNGSHLEISSNGCTAAFIHIMQGGNFIIGDNSVSNTATVSLNSESKIEVESNGNFIIHDNSILELNNNTEISKFKSGANVHLLNNSQIIVKGGHVLEIEPSANVTLEDGAAIVVEPNSKLILGDGQVFLNGSNASVSIKGTLEIPANTDLTINGTGFYQFGVGNNIVMGQGSKVNIIGGSRNYHDMIKIDNNAKMMVQNHNVKLEQGRIVYGLNSKIEVHGGGTLEMNNLTTVNYGVTAPYKGEAAIDVSNTHNVLITSCIIDDFVDGVKVHDYALDCVGYNGKPFVKIENCNFNLNGNSDIKVNNMQNTNVLIQGCTLANQNNYGDNGLDLSHCNKVEVTSCIISNKKIDGIKAENVNQLWVNSTHIFSNLSNGIEANNANVYVRNGSVVELNVNDGISLNYGGKTLSMLLLH
ncbi:MAG: hypothetical protein RL708_1774 [Bacteroidota bacterium]